MYAGVKGAGGGGGEHEECGWTGEVGYYRQR